MTKIITCSELRYCTLDELEALFRTLQIEFGRAAPLLGSGARAPSREVDYRLRKEVTRATAAGSESDIGAGDPVRGAGKQPSTNACDLSGGDTKLQTEE